MVTLMVQPARRSRPAVAAACALLLTLAPALGQATAGLDSAAAAYSGGRGTAARAERQVLPDLGLLLERQLIAGQETELSYYTLGGFWNRNRERGLAELWRQRNVDFLAKPPAQRSGEGLIPDIQVPLPGLGKVLGSGAEIKLNGLYKFTLGGQRTVYPNSTSNLTLGQQGSNFDLKIKQDYRVDLEGVVGERVHVLIDYDSQIETEKKHKIRLRYEGKEDEILQRLEAGDTEFSLTGSQLVGGLTTVHKGLFGVKAEARLAGLELTAIASKDEGQSQSNSYTGASSSQHVVIDDINYVRHRFFKLPLAPGDSLVDLRVVVRMQTAAGQVNTFSVNAVDSSWRHFAGLDSHSVRQYVVEEKQYPDFFTYNVPHISPRPGYLYLRQALGDGDMLGVAYKVRKAGGTLRWVPDSTILVPDTTVTKNVLLLKPPNCRPPDSAGTGAMSLGGYAWNYELRNFYDLGGRSVTNCSLSLAKRTTGGDLLVNDSASQKTFLHLIGLDADENLAVDIDWVKTGADDGYFFTPHEQPFAAMPDPNPALYTMVSYDQSLSKYRFAASYASADASYRFLASAGRIIEGSVRVFLNGEQVPASSYRVDYDIGELEFNDQQVRQRVQQPGAQLRIDYQYLPTFALGSKTLAGVRGVYKFSDRAVLGGTWLYRSEQTPEEKPRLGEEPSRIIVAGLDGSVEANPAFLTRAADALPLVETEAQSSVRLAGEYAANFPNPNTKGQVFIDDMDGAKQSDGLVLDRRSWSLAGAPPGRRDTLLADRCFWYNPTVRPTMGEINTAITDARARNEQVSTMRLRVEPRAGDTASWAGITTVLSRSGMDFTERKLLNVWVKGTRGRLHVDLGKEISEDQVRRRKDGSLVPANGRYDSEPLGPNNTQVRTDANDVGIDGTAAADAAWTAGSADDGNDDFNGEDVARANGTENNGQFDTEDLLLNGRRPGDVLTPANNYYTFEFDLSDGGANANGWHMYSVPLAGAGRVGAPYNWNDIYYGRIWVDSLSQPADIELALVEVAGNQWIEQPIARRDTSDSAAIPADETFAIGVRNNRDDAGYSANPPYDPGRDENGNLKFEQSLAFNVYNLRPGHAALGRRSLRAGENNYTGYRRLRLYVKGESAQDTFLVRLTAADTNVYYQYRAPTTGAWQDVLIELDRFSTLKKPPYDGRREDGPYSVRGSPSLANVVRIQLGVVSGRGQPYTGEVLFDDLRLDDVRRDRGTAYWSTIDLKMADLLSLSGGYRRTGAHFYAMGGRAPGTSTVSYNASAALTLSKFYLDRAGFSLPLSLAQTVSEGYDEFGGDDIRLTDEESRAQRSWSRSRSGGFSLTRTKPMGWWLADATVNRLSYRGDWSQGTGFSRTGADSSSTFTQTVAYGWSPSQNRGLSVLKLTRFYYLPSSLTSTWSSGQTRRWSLEKASGVQSTAGSGMTRSLTGSLGWKLTDQLNYTLSQNRDLMQHKWAGSLARRLQLGSEVSRSQRVEYNTTINWLKLVKPTLGYSTTYSEQHSIMLLSGGADSVMVMGVTNANALTTGTDVPVGSWLAKITALRNEQKDTSAEAGSPRWMVIQLDRLFRSWSGVQVSFTQNKSGSASGLTRRPSAWYQLGWHRRPGDIERLGSSSQDNNTLGNSYSAGTQARIGPVNLSGNWSRSDDWTTTGAITNYRRVDNWPTLRADVTGVEKVWPQAMSSSRLATSYALTRERAWQQDRGLSRDATRRSLSPLVDWSCSWKPRFSTSLTYDLLVQDVREPSPQYFSGWRRDHTQTNKLSGSLSYSLTAQKGLAFNLWKLGKRRFKFNNELRTSLSGSYSVRTQTQLDALSALKEAPPTADQEELSLTTQAEYRFTNSITGSLSANYGTVTNRINSVGNSQTYGLDLLINVIF